MTFQPDIRHRRSADQKTSPVDNKAMFLITLWSSERGETFGRMTDYGIVLNKVGELVEAEWRVLFRRWPAVSTDSYAILPDRVRGIVAISPPDSRNGLGRVTDRFRKPLSVFLPDVIRVFKAVSSRVVAGLAGIGRRPLWEHDHFEHLIQDERELAEIRLSMARTPLLLSSPALNPPQSVKTIDRHPEL